LGPSSSKADGWQHSGEVFGIFLFFLFYL
jgi:hypothetical protein